MVDASDLKSDGQLNAREGSSPSSPIYFSVKQYFFILSPISHFMRLSLFSLLFFVSVGFTEPNQWTISLSPKIHPGIEAWVQEWQSFLKLSSISQIQIVPTSKNISLYFFHTGKATFPISKNHLLPLNEFQGGTCLGELTKTPSPLLLSTPMKVSLEKYECEISLENLTLFLRLSGGTRESQLQFVQTQFLSSWIFDLQEQKTSLLVSLHPEACEAYLKQFFLAVEDWDLARYSLNGSYALLDRLRQAGSKNSLLYYWLAKKDPVNLDLLLEEGKKRALESSVFLRQFSDYAFAEGKFSWSLQSLNLIYPLEAELLSKKGYILILMEREQEARALFLEALALQPKQEEALFNLGRICFRQSQFQQAVAYFLQVGQIRPQPEINRYIARCYSQLNRTEEAIQLLEQLWEKGRGDPLLVSELMTLYLKQRQWKKSIQLLEEAKNVYPQHPFVLLAESESLLYEQQFEQAFVLADAVRQKYPQNERAHFLVGKALLAIGDIERGEPLIRQAYQKQPQSPEMIEAMGHLLFAKGLFGEALPLLSQSFCSDTVYARCLHYQGKLEESFQCFQKIMGQERVSEEEVVAYFRLLLEYHFSRAVSVSNSFLEQWPDSVELLFYQGQMEMLRGQHLSAQKKFRQCLQRFPEYEYFHFWIYFTEVFLEQIPSLAKAPLQSLWLKQLRQHLLSQSEKQPQRSEEWLEFYFYLGLQKIAQGKLASGQTLWQKALETKKIDHIEYRFILAYLKK